MSETYTSHSPPPGLLPELGAELVICQGPRASKPLAQSLCGVPVGTSLDLFPLQVSKEKARRGVRWMFQAEFRLWGLRFHPPSPGKGWSCPTRIWLVLISSRGGQRNQRRPGLFVDFFPPFRQKESKQSLCPAHILSPFLPLFPSLPQEPDNPKP